MPASTRTSTITTSTATTFTSVSSFLPPRAEQRIHIWLSEVSVPSPADSGASSAALYAPQPTLNHGRVSVAQLYATKEKGSSLRERLRKLGRLGRKEPKVWGFSGERVGGDLNGTMPGDRTDMYGLDVPEMAGRASLVMEDDAAAARERDDAMRDARGDLWGEAGVVRLNGSDFGAGLVGERRLQRQYDERVDNGEKRYSHLY